MRIRPTAVGAPRSDRCSYLLGASLPCNQLGWLCDSRGGSLMHVFVLKGDSICTVGVIAPEMGTLDVAKMTEVFCD